MKQLYALFAALALTVSLSAQCVIDSTRLTSPGIYPDFNHIPHIVKDSLYDQTVQGRIIASYDTVFAGVVSVSIRVDSVRLDSILGLPNGINWVKNPDILYGGGLGCVEFTGTTSDSPGVYNLRAIGMIWAHLKVPLLGLDKDTFSYGNIMRFPPFNRYSLVVDSAQLPLSVVMRGGNTCYGETNGFADVTPVGGSPVSPYVYSWNTGATGYRLSNVGAGTYIVTVTSGTETAVDSVTVTSPAAPLAGTIQSTDAMNNDGTASITVTGGDPPYRYFWSNGQQTSSVTGLRPGTYFVSVNDNSGCGFLDTVVIANLNDGIIVLKDDVSKLRVYPNPANNVLNVDVETTNNLNVRLEAVDMTGRVVYSEPLTVAGKYRHSINTAQFTPGIYILQVVSSNQSVRQRFVVTH